MDTTNYPSPYPENKDKRKDSRNIFIVLLALAFCASLGYAIYNGNNHHRIQKTQLVELRKTDDERSGLQRKFDDALARLDLLTGTSNKLQGSINERGNDIAKMKYSIRKILAKQDITDAERKKAEHLIAELNQRISDMMEQTARLTQDNQNLVANNARLAQDTEQLTSDLKITSDARDQLATKVDFASTFVASNIRINPVQIKSGGEEKITDKAKKVDELKVMFDISNRIAASGEADLYVRITAPDGKIIFSPEKGSGTFTVRDEGEKEYTSKVSVPFETGKVKPVEVVWKQESGFEKGPYLIEIYHNGFKIGESSKELKKGGIF
ncbi:MAG TPA: hypothetical protein VMI12_09515 [Puia sp.]|nr:hypothetical protein [Puia sp.]